MSANRFGARESLSPQDRRPKPQEQDFAALNTDHLTHPISPIMSLVPPDPSQQFAHILRCVWLHRERTERRDGTEKLTVVTLCLARRICATRSCFLSFCSLLNTNVDGKNKIMFALTEIKGVGRRYANIVCKKADVDLAKRLVLLFALSLLAGTVGGRIGRCANL